MGALRSWARRRLHDARGGHNARPREATTLLARALGWSEAQVLARDDRELTEEERRIVERLVERRLRGEPFAYLFREREFYGRRFRVDDRVLIPRPETEHLVEEALQRAPAGARVLDVGTGSGCIAITLAAERPDLRVVATDICLGALAVAHVNARRLLARGSSGTLSLVASDLLTAVEPASFQVLVSNPPYVDPAHRHQLSPEVRDWEPAPALFAEDHGLSFYRRLLAGAASRLAPGALVLLELGAGQTESVSALAGSRFAPGETAGGAGTDRPGVVRDYAGHERVLVLARADAG